MTWPALLILLLTIHTVGEPEHRLREATGYDRGQPTPVLLQRLPGKSLDGRELWLEHRAADAWGDLVEYAARSGHHLQPTYAFRDEGQQKRLYRQNPRLAARPGHSNHQLGLSLDVNGMSRRGKRTDLFFWMRREAERFGFVSDVGHEPWHFTFFGPDAGQT